MQYRENDYGAYDKTTNKSIDICLTCTEFHCTGECERIRQSSLKEKEYIIKRTKLSSKGIIKTSYIAYFKNGSYTTSANIWHVKKGARETMEYLLSVIQKKSPASVGLEVVKWSDELEKVTKEKRKTHRGGCRFYVDANGNRLGR